METLSELTYRGKELTITHEDVQRYFMTIPEAAALVIEAAVMADKGETFLLDMGEPVRMLDLVEKFVQETGCDYPKIIYTGLRPGEKMSEELFDPSETRTPTLHDRIEFTRPGDTTTINPIAVLGLFQMVSNLSEPEDLKAVLRGLLTPDTYR